MTNDDRGRFAAILENLAEVFHQDVSARRAELYFFALQDLTIEEISQAAIAGIHEWRFFPKPVEFRDFVNGGTLAERAAYQWTRAISGRELDSFGQAAENQATIGLGWVMSNGTTNDINRARAEFIQLYQGVYKRHTIRKAIPQARELLP